MQTSSGGICFLWASRSIHKPIWTEIWENWCTAYTQWRLIIFIIHSVKITYTCRACHLASYVTHIMVTSVSYKSMDSLVQNGLRRLKMFEKYWACYAYVQLMIQIIALDVAGNYRQSSNSVWGFWNELCHSKTGSSNSTLSYSYQLQQKNKNSVPPAFLALLP